MNLKSVFMQKMKKRKFSNFLFHHVASTFDNICPSMSGYKHKSLRYNKMVSYKWSSKIEDINGTLRKKR